MISPSELYYFSNYHLVVAFNHAGKPTDIFMTYPDETFTRKELFDYFNDTSLSYLVAAEVPEVNGLTMENYHSILSEIIVDIYENKLDELSIKHYIPVTIH